MSLLALSGTNSVSGGYEIDNSLKLEADNSEYLNRTPAANGSRTTWTTSVWVKRTEIGVNQAVFSSVSNASYTNFYRFLDSDKIRFYFQPDDVAATYYADTNAVFRDTSAWYHIVWGLDSTNSDGSKRFVVYVNGVYQESTWAGSATASTNCPQNSGSRFLQSEPIYIGKATYTNGHYFSGYMADLHVLDGIAPDPTDFGEFDDDTGIWKPKAYTGSHGTQGFYLDFADAADLGDDESGNGNDFTENNITSADQAQDSPTNNFCVINAINLSTQTLTQGATKIVSTDNTSRTSFGTMAVSKGKWWWEGKIQVYESNTTYPCIGVTGDLDNPPATSAQLWKGNHVVVLAKAQKWVTNDTGYSYGTAYADNDIINIALDMDNHIMYTYKNGTIDDASGINFSSQSAATADDFYIPINLVYVTGGGSSWEMNFGGYANYTISSAESDANGYGNFEYAPPTGYYALCSKNLAEFG